MSGSTTEDAVEIEIYYADEDGDSATGKAERTGILPPVCSLVAR